MKFVLFLILSILSSTSFSKDYTLKSKEILGLYEEVSSGNYYSFDGLEVKFNSENKLMVYLMDRTFELSLERNKILFSEDVDDECDNPGCGTMTYIDGVITSKKVGGKILPYIKIEYTVAFYYPDDVDALEGEHTFQAEFLWKERIIDEKPLAYNVKIEKCLLGIKESCDKAREGGADLFCITRIERKRFIKNMAFSIDSEGFKKVFYNSDSWVKLNAEEIETLIITQAQLRLNFYKISLKYCDDCSRDKEAIKNYEKFISDLKSYLTIYSSQRVYMRGSNYTRLFSGYEINSPTLYLVNDRYRSVTTLRFSQR